MWEPVPQVAAMSWGGRCVDKLLPGRSKGQFYCWSGPRGGGGQHAHQFFYASGRMSVALRCNLIRSCILRQQLGKHAVKPLPGKNWVMGIFADFLCTEPGRWGIASESICLTTASLFFMVSWDS